MNMEKDEIFYSADRFWEKVRQFFYRNRTIAEMVFILVYAMEQVALVYFAFIMGSREQLSVIVSLFSILVLTTFSMHKLVMESRIRLLEDSLQEVMNDKSTLERKNMDILRGYEEIVKAFQKKMRKA